MTFEESYAKLEKIKDALENPETTLDESIKLYEESVKHTKTCLDLLSSTEGKITVIKAEVDKLTEKPLDVQE
jgi:exodeoxyribonuclease VII small subunit